MNDSIAKPTLHENFDPDTAMDTLASLVGLQIPNTSREMVATHLKVAASMADIVYAAPLDNNKMEPANVFTPDDSSSRSA